MHTSFGSGFPAGGLICLVIGGALLLIPLIWFITNYNSLVRCRNHVRESWSGIDTELKRRYDLIPNLVETVKGYAAHERQVLERVVEARGRAVASTGSPGSQVADENELVRALRQVFVLVEAYPQLKSDRNFRELQSELVNTEDRLQAARRFYNANVREYNNRVQMFPSSLVAGVFTFVPGEFFEIEETGLRQPPAVDLA